jgi:hypothetical protein
MTDTTYKPGPASVFATIARGKTLTIWAYCPCCWTQTYQDFVRDCGKCEQYRCQTCGNVREVAVR